MSNHADAAEATVTARRLTEGTVTVLAGQQVTVSRVEHIGQGCVEVWSRNADGRMVNRTVPGNRRFVLAG